MTDQGLRPLKVAQRRSLEAATAAAEKNLSEAEEFLKVRAIPLDIAERFRLGVVTDPIPGQPDGLVGRLCIPFLGPSGPVYVQYRCLAHEDCKSSGCTKFLGWSGAGSRLFNTRGLVEAESVIQVCEGPLDAIALSSVGLPAVGVPGANKWSPHWPQVFAGFRQVIVHGDGDKPGRDFCNKWLKEMDNAVPVNYPDGEDVNSVLVSEGPEALLRMVEEASADE